MYIEIFSKKKKTGNPYTNHSQKFSSPRPGPVVIPVPIGTFLGHRGILHVKVCPLTLLVFPQ
jgi:hypothetical protein